MQTKKQRVDLSEQDMARLDHIAKENSFASERCRSAACTFSIHRQLKRLDVKYEPWARAIDQDEEQGLIPWGFECSDAVRGEIERIRDFYGLKYISTAVRLSIRLQAKEDGYGK